MSGFKKSITIIFIVAIVAITFIFLREIVTYSKYPLYYKEEIGESSSRYDLDPYLVASIINVESKYRKDALSPKNARGLMQISESTGEWGSKEIGIDNYEKDILFLPKENIEIGTWYLTKLRDEFNGDQDLILAAYNGGSGNVNKWLKDESYSKDGKTLYMIPFKETREYVEKVKKNYENYKELYEETDFENGNFNSKYINIIYNIKGYFRKISNYERR